MWTAAIVVAFVAMLWVAMNHECDFPDEPWLDAWTEPDPEEFNRTEEQ